MEHVCKNCGLVFTNLNELIRHITSDICKNTDNKENNQP